MIVSEPVENMAETSSTPLWLVTFADLTALLVALFVLIYSMSTPVALVKSGTGLVGQGLTSVASDNAGQRAADSAPRSGVAGDLTLGYLAAVLSDRKISEVSTAGAVTHRLERDRLVVRFDAAFLFQDRQGQTTDRLSPLGEARLGSLAQLLGSVGNPVSFIVPVQRDDWVLAFDQTDMLEASFRRAGYERAVDRFVAPGIDPADGNRVMLVIARRNGGRHT